MDFSWHPAVEMRTSVPHLHKQYKKKKNPKSKKVLRSNN